MMLKQEPVSRVRVDLQLRLRYETCQQVRVVRKNHWVAVPVGDEYRHLNPAHSFEERVVWDTPATYGVVLRFAGRPIRRNIDILRPTEDPIRCFSSCGLARRSLCEEHAHIALGTGVFPAHSADHVRRPTVHPCRSAWC